MRYAATTMLAQTLWLMASVKGVTIGRGSRSTIHLDKTDLNRLRHGIKGAKSLQTRVSELIAIMKESAEPMRKEMEITAPVDTGALRKSFKSRKLLKAPPGIIGIRVGAARGAKLAGWRAHFPEYGTKKMAAQPFIRKAIARYLPQTLQTLKAKLQSLLIKTTKIN